MGRPKSEEHKRKISAALKGRKHSPESNRKRSEAMRKFWGELQALRAEKEGTRGNG